jgi:dihydroorotate dehydrogenase (NAD+) catalytic subunit
MVDLQKVDMTVKIGNVTLKNPIMPASGAFSTDLAQVMDINRLGALVAKTVSREFRIGNPPPRVAELECGMINSIGLPTKGIEYFLSHQVPDYKRFTPPLVASISAQTADDFEAMTRDVDVPDVDIVEVNISCPTRNPGGGNFAMHEDHTFAVMSRIRKMTKKPVWAKLSPNAGDVVAIAKAAESAGADALVVSNTILGLKINVDTFRPAIGNKFGGISGPGVKPIIVRMVYQCAKAVKIPVIGCGGIVKVEDVVEYMLAGASAVMMGYIIFRNPSGMIAILDGLEEWCRKRGFARVADLTGAMIDDAPMETFAAAAAAIGGQGSGIRSQGSGG